MMVWSSHDEGNSRRIGVIRAFTIVELMVVLAVVAVLVAVMLPALAKARAAARATRCLNRLGQLGVANSLYLNDFRETFPQPIQDGYYGTAHGYDAGEKGRNCWFNALDYYLHQSRKTYTNASHRNYVAYKQDPVWATLSDNAQKYNRTIKMNLHFGDRDNDFAKWTRGPDIPSPTRTVLLGDGRAQDISSESILSIPGYFHLTVRYIGLRHGGGANIQFVDGHARRVRQPINHSEAQPAWYAQSDPRQTLIWDFD